VPENETIALAEDLAFREKAMWLLIRKLGGEVEITAEEWASVPEEPCMILGRESVTRWGKAYDVMRWTAKERSDDKETRDA
jgi:hypothetical protein